MIDYKETRTFAPEALKELFLADGWSSGHFSDTLAEAMQNSDSVFSAWDGDRLVGLASVLDDGVMTAYIHYLIVHPDYEGRGIGTQLLDNVKERYKDFMRITHICYNSDRRFFKSCGFEVDRGSSACSITTLWT